MHKYNYLYGQFWGRTPLMVLKGLTKPNRWNVRYWVVVGMFIRFISPNTWYSKINEW